MFGYPGAGKTTTAEAIRDVTGAVHLSSDALRSELFHPPQFTQAEHDELYQSLDKKTELLLNEGKDVIYDANLNRYQHRRDKYDICERTGAQPVLLWVQTAKDIARERALDLRRSHLVPRNETAEEMFERIVDLIEEPGADEPYLVIDGTKVTPKYIQDLLPNQP